MYKFPIVVDEDKAREFLAVIRNINTGDLKWYEAEGYKLFRTSDGRFVAYLVYEGEQNGPRKLDVS